MYKVLTVSTNRPGGTKVDGTTTVGCRSDRTGARARDGAEKVPAGFLGHNGEGTNIFT